VLIVDDCAALRSRLVHLFAEFKQLQVVGEAEDGRSALEAIGTLEPNLVTLDINMPELTGLDVLRGLKGKARKPQVIVLAVLIDRHDRELCLELGASHVFDKVLELEGFLQTVRSLAML